MSSKLNKKKIISYKNSCDKATSWLLNFINSDGSIGPVNERLYYYRVPWCLALMGEHTVAQNKLNWITDCMFTSDGEFEGIPCSDSSGDHYHNGIDGGWSYGLAATLEFNQQLKLLGAYQTSADAYYWSGVNKWNFADTDAFSDLSLWEQTNVGRMYIYDSSFSRLQTSGQIGVNDLTTFSKNSPDCSNKPLSRIGCIDFVFGTQYLLGSIPLYRSNQLWDPNDLEAKQIEMTLKKWTTFYTTYRSILTAKLVHLQRPNSRDIESVLHVAMTPQNEILALLSLINPSRTKTITQKMVIPLYYTGLGPGNKVLLETLNVSSSLRAIHHDSKATEMHFVGEEGGGYTDIVVDVILPPASYTVLLVKEEARQQ